MIFDGVQKQWASADMVETDCTDEVDKLGQACDTTLYSEFQAQYKDFRLFVGKHRWMNRRRDGR